MKNQSDKEPAAPSLVRSVPYVPALLVGCFLSERDKAIAPHVKGFSDEETAKEVVCRPRIVKHFRQRLGIPDLRQRSHSRSMPFTVIQSFGLLAGTCFVSTVLRRLPGAKIGTFAEESRVRQSFSPASEITQSLASLEGLFDRAVYGVSTNFETLRSALEKSLFVHGEVKKHLPATSTESSGDLQARPISVILLAGGMAPELERYLNTSRFKTDLSVIHLTSTREIVAFLDCSIFALYSSRLWLGLGEMVAAGKTGLNNEPPLLNCSMEVAEILRLIDGIHGGVDVSSSSATALQPPGLHLRHFARSDGFLLQGRHDRNPLYYTAKPWALGEDGSGRPSVAYALPYDIPEAMEFYSAPEWLADVPSGIRSLEQNGEHFLIAREDGLLGAVARAVRSDSFKAAIKATLDVKLGLGVSLLAPWCKSFLVRSTRTSRRPSKTEFQLIAISALMSFDADFLMRHFDQIGKDLVEGIEAQWANSLATMLAKFTKRLQGETRKACGNALADFIKIHRRPVRYLLVSTKRRAERICQEHIRRSQGLLSQRFEALQADSRTHSKMERKMIEQTMQEVGLYVGLAVGENKLRHHFVRYASLIERGTRCNTHIQGSNNPPIGENASIEEADDLRGRLFTMGQMWDPENSYED